MYHEYRALPHIGQNTQKLVFAVFASYIASILKGETFYQKTTVKNTGSHFTKECVAVSINICPSSNLVLLMNWVSRHTHYLLYIIKRKSKLNIPVTSTEVDVANWLQQV